MGQGCSKSSPINISGFVAVVERGNCTFVQKCENMQATGATAIIVTNNVDGGVISMGGTSQTCDAYVVMISKEDGRALKALANLSTAPGRSGQIPGQNEETRGPAEGFPETMSTTKRDPASMLEVCLYKELFFSMTSYFFSNFFS
jgi:hypothetical protein